MFSKFSNIFTWFVSFSSNAFLDVLAAALSAHILLNNLCITNSNETSILTNWLDFVIPQPSLKHNLWLDEDKNISYEHFSEESLQRILWTRMSYFILIHPIGVDHSCFGCKISYFCCERGKEISPLLPHRRTLWQAVCSTSSQSHCKPRIPNSTIRWSWF